MCLQAPLSHLAALPTPFQMYFSVKNGHLVTRKTRQRSVLGVPAGRGLNRCLDWDRLSQGPTLGRGTSPFMARAGLCLCPQAKESCSSL